MMNYSINKLFPLFKILQLKSNFVQIIFTKLSFNSNLIIYIKIHIFVAVYVFVYHSMVLSL